MFYKELFEDCSFNDLTYSKKSHLWMKWDLSDSIWSHEETNNQDFYTSSL